MDPEFLEKINAQFLCLTTTIVSHALRCWQTEVFNDEVHFTYSNSPGKPPITNQGPQRKSTDMLRGWMEYVTGLFKRQLDTWAKSRGFQTQISGGSQRSWRKELLRSVTPV